MFHKNISFFYVFLWAISSPASWAKRARAKTALGPASLRYSRLKKSYRRKETTLIYTSCFHSNLEPALMVNVLHSARKKNHFSRKNVVWKWRTHQKNQSNVKMMINATTKKIANVKWCQMVLKLLRYDFNYLSFWISRHSSQPITIVYFLNWPIASLGENK